MSSTLLFSITCVLAFLTARNDLVFGTVKARMLCALEIEQFE